MASCWGLIVALLALNAGLSVAQNVTATTSAVIATPTTPLAAATSTTGGGGGGATQIVPTPTASVAPASTSASTPGPRFYTYLTINFKASDCPSGKDASFNSTFRSYFADPKFDLQGVAYSVTREPCRFSFNFTFGLKLQRYDVIEIFQKELKSKDNSVAGLKLTDMKIEVRVNGAVLDKFEDLETSCKEKCCGTGGPITLNITCASSGKCGSYKFTKTVEKCMDVCTKCSGVVYKISLLVLLFSVFMNWFLK